MRWGANDTHCHRGHDLRLPNAIGQDNNSAKRFCRLCRNLRKLASLERQRQRPRMCPTCKAAITHSGTWRYCSTQCERVGRSRSAATVTREDHARTAKMLALYDELERARSWERAEVRARIAEELNKDQGDGTS